MTAAVFPASLPCPGCGADCPVEQEHCPACGMKVSDHRAFTTPAERLRATFELIDAGVEHYRQRMVRENPQATEAEINAMVQAWRLEAPCEEAGEVAKEAHRAAADASRLVDRRADELHAIAARLLAEQNQEG